ncbi:MAG: DUF1186 domain-containing protein [Proteobacteria bacterium]|nr:DUF1186 domain-containing protein [Pseudomonadota bacterium]
MGDLIFLSRDDPQYILDGLSHRENKQHFRQSLVKATAAATRMTPFLLNWLDTVVGQPNMAAQFGNPLKTTASLFLLAALREQSALPNLIRIVEMDDPSFEDLVEAEGIEGLSRILAAMSETDELMALASDPDRSLILRESCIDALLLHFTEDRLEFDELAEFLYEQWSVFRASDYEYWRTCLLTSFYIADDSHYEEMKRLALRIKESYREDLLQMLGQDQQPDGKAVRASLFANPEFQAIRDPVAELRDMAVFEFIASTALEIATGLRLNDDEAEVLGPELSYRFQLRLRQSSSFFCSIELLDTHDLHDLHLAIQKALAWKLERSYAFFLDNRFEDSEQAYGAAAHGGDATAVPLGDFCFYLGQEFAYQCDGDSEHSFILQLEAMMPLSDSGLESFIPLIVCQAKGPSL